MNNQCGKTGKNIYGQTVQSSGQQMIRRRVIIRILRIERQPLHLTHCIDSSISYSLRTFNF